MRVRLVVTTAMLCAFGCGAFLIPGCTTQPTAPSCPADITRAETIPADAVKMTPATDTYPPIMHSAEWDDPVLMPGPVNTAGSEDAPVMSADGETFYFFFTPDSSVPAEEQLFDCVTGVWWCTREGRSWSEPVRAVLSDDLALDGPMCDQSGTLWFASFRTGGYKDGDMYTATWNGLSWSWQNAGEQLNADYEIGEVYLTAHGDTMVYARDTAHGIHGGYDLWESHRVAGGWSEPTNLGPDVNSDVHDGWPYLTPDGSELWFTSFVSDLGYPGPSIYRTVRTDRGWSDPEEMVSHYVGDPGMDAAGNLYFTHHYIDAAGETIETDIYVCYRR